MIESAAGEISALPEAPQAAACQDERRRLQSASPFQQGRQREDDETDEEDALAPEQIARPAAEEWQPPNVSVQGVDDPLQVARPCSGRPGSRAGRRSLIVASRTTMNCARQTTWRARLRVDVLRVTGFLPAWRGAATWPPHARE